MYTFELLRGPGALRDAGHLVIATVVARDTRRATNALEAHLGFRPEPNRVQRVGSGDPSDSGNVRMVPVTAAVEPAPVPEAPPVRRAKRSPARELARILAAR